jgi:hypothetical protein
MRRKIPWPNHCSNMQDGSLVVGSSTKGSNDLSKRKIRKIIQGEVMDLSSAFVRKVLNAG